MYYLYAGVRVAPCMAQDGLNDLTMGANPAPSTLDTGLPGNFIATGWRLQIARLSFHQFYNGIDTHVSIR